MRFRSKQSVMLAAPAVMLALAGPASGGEPDVQRPENAQPPSESNAAPAEAVRNMEDMHASRLIGMEVRDRSGEHVGELGDVVVDLSDDRIRYAVVAAGGFLGIGEKHYAYPMSRFSKSSDDDHLVLVLDIDTESLSKAPVFYSDWPDFNDPEYQARLDGTSGGVTPRTGEPDLRRVSELLGIDVRSPSGVQVGELEDFLIDLQNGKARAVVTFDPGESAEERLVAVPPNRLGVPRYSDDAVINMTQSELMNAPRVADHET